MNPTTFTPTLRAALAKAGYTPGPARRAGKAGWSFTIASATGPAEPRLQITVEPAP